MITPRSSLLRTHRQQQPATAQSDAFIRFLQRHSVKRFAKNSIVLHQGEIPTSVYVVKKGIVRSYSISDSGDEKPINFCSESEIIATTWVFQKAPAAVYFYEAYVDCEVYSVPRDQLRAFISSNNEVMAQLLDRYVTKYIGKTLRINALEYSRAIDKISHTLQYLCLSYGRESEAGVVEIELPLAQQELANLTGLTRETTGLELKKLQQRGVITYQKRRFIVHTDELRKVIGEDELSDLKLR